MQILEQVSYTMYKLLIKGNLEANYSSFNELLSKSKQEENRIIDIFIKWAELKKRRYTKTI